MRTTAGHPVSGKSPRRRRDADWPTIATEEVFSVLFDNPFLHTLPLAATRWPVRRRWRPSMCCGAELTGSG